MALSAGLSNSPAVCAAGGLGSAAVVEGNAVPVAPNGPLRRALGVAVGVTEGVTEGVTGEGWGMLGLLSAAP